MDAVCREAARALGAGVAWIGVLESDGERVLAATGARSHRLPLETSFAAAIAGELDAVAVADASGDGRFSAHPLVVGPPNIRMYVGVPLRDPDGRFVGALSVVDRQSRQPAPEQVDLLRLLGKVASCEIASTDALREAEDRFRDFFEHAGDFIVSIASDGRVLHANQVAELSLGLRRGTQFATVVEPARRDEFTAALGRAVETGNAERVETVFTPESGAPMTLEGWLRPRTIDGRVALVRVVFRDVTDRKQFEAEMGNARDAALEAARAKTRFLANVSHEIRTPMNGIVGMIDLLLSTGLDAEQRDFAHQARSSADKLLSIVNNILYISNLEGGGLTSARVDFDLRGMLQRIVDVERVAVLGRNIDVSFTCDERVPPMVRGNQSKVRQVLTNLLDNAAKFTEQGSVHVGVSLQTETETRHVVRFEVRDTGRGIADEDRLILFERFSQIEAASTRRFDGVGLGLATARHLVETMGGLIDVESEPGRGSTFWFTIPFLKVARGREPIPTSAFELAGQRVLLMDRNPSSRRIVLHYLAKTWEMRVDTAENAEETLAALRREAQVDPYRLLVCDANPQAANAYRLARDVREDPKLAATRVLCLVAEARLVNEEVLREAGVSAWTQTPIGQRELFDALAIALASDAAAAPARPLPLAEAPQSAPAVAPAAAANLRLLLAEDNFLNMKLTMTQLQKLGFAADLAVNGREVLEAVAKKDYDVILMDCQMPVLDGYEATIEIRRLETAGARRRHWIIAMTANALEGDREKCLAAGMDDYLAKPTHHDDLSRALQRPAANLLRA